MWVALNSFSLSDTGRLGPVVLSGEVSKSSINFRKPLSLHRTVIHPEEVLSFHQIAFPFCSPSSSSWRNEHRLSWNSLKCLPLWTSQRKATHLAQNGPQGPRAPNCLIRPKVSIWPHFISAFELPPSLCWPSRTQVPPSQLLFYFQKLSLVLSLSGLEAAEIRKGFS